MVPRLTGENKPKTIFVDADLTSVDGIVSLELVSSEIVKEKYVAVTYKVLKDA